LEFTPLQNSVIVNDTVRDTTAGRTRIWQQVVRALQQRYGVSLPFIYRSNSRPQDLQATRDYINDLLQRRASSVSVINTPADNHTPVKPETSVVERAPAVVLPKPKASPEVPVLASLPVVGRSGQLQVAEVQLKPTKRFRDLDGFWHQQGEMLENGYWLKDVYARGIVLANGENLIILQVE